jgi:glycosyltransferase involved in cell wall biosynthesis
VNKDLINHQSICVLVPTYNNERTLKRVIDGVLKYTSNIIIINDGATDTTANILEPYLHLEIITIVDNTGKGHALRQGFKKATALGYDYAITIDSDGQHFPEDIPVFVNALHTSENKNLLLIGARNMEQAGVPGKSSFGNKFSNFWFWFETGIKLTDTQSGFRLYPLKAIEKLKLYTNKFELEIEVIVKAAWNDVEVKNIPIQILYDKNERVSHFRPFKDFTRISILNTCLVLLTIFYVKPRDLFRKLKKKGIKRFFVEDFLGSDDSSSKKALSISLGVFIGLSPFWGFHTITVIFSAIFLKLNKAIAFAFSNVSLPPFIPFILYASFKLGEYILGLHHEFTIETFQNNFNITDHLKTYIVGSFALAASCATISGLLGFIFFSIFEKKKISLQNG